MKHEIIGANVTRVEGFAAADAIANEKGNPLQVFGARVWL